MIPLQREVKDLEEARIRKEEARVADEQRRRNELERQRLMKEKAFPTSIDDYHAKSPAVQKLVRERRTLVWGNRSLMLYARTPANNCGGILRPSNSRIWMEIVRPLSLSLVRSSQ